MRGKGLSEASRAGSAVLTRWTVGQRTLASAPCLALAQRAGGASGSESAPAHKKLFALHWRSLSASGALGQDAGTPGEGEGSAEKEEDDGDEHEQEVTPESVDDVVYESFKNTQEQLRGMIERTNGLQLPPKDCTSEQAESFLRSVEQHYEDLEVPTHVDRLQAELNYSEFKSDGDAHAYADELGALANELNVQNSESIAQQVHQAVDKAAQQLEREIRLDDEEAMRLVYKNVHNALVEEGLGGLFDDEDAMEEDAFRSRVAATREAIHAANVEAEQEVKQAEESIDAATKPTR